MTAFAALLNRGYGQDSGVDKPLPIFDTHVHYSQNSWDRYSPADIIAKMENAGVVHALVSSYPDDGTLMLYKEDPKRIIPFLRPYFGEIGPRNWIGQQQAVVPYLEQRLQRPIYRGIGEFHLHYDAHASAPLMRRIIRSALEHGLYLHVHSNAKAVRIIFSYEPQVKILWAHAGLATPPETVSQMMDEYKNLWTDISIREWEIAPGGQLDPHWRALFLKHPDRITIGSDTWIAQRWDEYENILAFDRRWLAQLPRDVAEKIAYRNAMWLFVTQQ